MELFYKSFDAPFSFKEGMGDDSNFIMIEGYASTFGDVDRVGDIVQKGAFTKSIAERVPKMLYQHRSSEPIGVWDEMNETSKGLYVKGRLPKDNSQVKDIIPLVKMGAIDSMSIGYNTVVSEWNDKTNVRTLKEVDLWEVSLVTFPANTNAKIERIKKLFEDNPESLKADPDEKMIDMLRAESITSKKEFEEMLRETGMFSRKAATILASRFIEEKQREAVVEQSDSVVSEILKSIELTKKGLNHG